MLSKTQTLVFKLHKWFFSYTLYSFPVYWNKTHDQLICTTSKKSWLMLCLSLLYHFHHAILCGFVAMRYSLVTPREDFSYMNLAIILAAMFVCLTVSIIGGIVVRGVKSHVKAVNEIFQLERRLLKGISCIEIKCCDTFHQKSFQTNFSVILRSR